MLLKSLTMQGFKSFPDKVNINFGSGMTGIVGPNGSGKSNISDAIRWVFGEQSSKMLRGTKMEDVIFGGTQKRNPMGYCEVSLSIDNSGRQFRMDCDEIEVSRRYYRSGESEYRINRKTVRLRDVNELFMDTGLGRDGYSIIGQGRIDEVLSIKSEDRREIFEEAAGISKFRYRKEEAERKLRDTADNLVRLNDILAELEARVGPLKKKSEKAQAFLKIRDEMKLLEIDLWSDRVCELRAAASKANADLNICELDLAEAKGRLEKIYTQNERIAEQLQAKAADTENERALLRETEARIAALESSLAVIKANQEHTRLQLERLENELAAGRTGGEELVRQLEGKKEEIASLDRCSEENSAELEKIYALASEMSEKIDDIDSRIEGLNASAAALRLEAGTLRASADAADEAAQDVDGRRAAVASDIAAISSRIEEEKKNEAEIKQGIALKSDILQSAQNVINGYSLRLDGQTKKAQTLSDELMKLTMDLNAASSRLHMLKELEKDYEGYSRAVKSVMQLGSAGGLKGILGTVAGLLKVDPEYTVAIETALGGTMQNIVARTEEDSRDAINYLKAHDAGRATFLSLTAIKPSSFNERGVENEPGFVGIADELCGFDPEFKSIFSFLLGRTVIVERLDGAIRMARKYSHRFRIVTLDGQIINAGGAMTGGSVSRSTGILSRTNEISDLTSKVEKLSVRKTELAERADAASRELAKTRYDIEQASVEKREAEDALLALESTGKQQAILLESLEARLEELLKEDGSADKYREEMEKKAAKLRADADAKDAEASAVDAEIASAEGGKERSEADKGRLTDRIAELRERMAAESAARAAAVTAAQELEARIDTAKLSAAALEQQLKESRELLEARGEERVQTESHIALGRTAVSAHEETIATLAAERTELEARRTESDADLRQTNDRVIALEREQSRLQQQRESGADEERSIADRLWENYELTVNEAIGMARPIENKTALRARISELRQARKSLGEVDVSAIEEYAEVSKRYEYLTAQHADVEKSRDELNGLISEIVGEMESIFRGKFDEISTAFSETFTEIFGGGGAELRLADENDILNCGIEIKAQPPGKNLKMITLLSGGEKALVAIALYFAILKVRPTPFCVLDEIDAALDDINVMRFNRYLKILTDNTQFIVMTHRRGTMEMADILYGVTMQEQGVSKVLMLDMNEIEKRFGVQ